ncbi:MAG: hypothetical protein ACTSWN_04045 [Promethearchaeota archaeon]
MVITSPPYIYAGEYLRSSKLKLYWLGEIDDVKVKKLTRNKIGHRKIKSLDEVNQEINHVKFFNETMKRLIFIEKKKYGKNGIYTPRVANYFHDMNLLIKKMKKVLKNKGIFAFFVGNPTVLGAKVSCWKIFLEFFEDLEYKILEYGYGTIVSRALLKGRKNASHNGMQHEWLIVAENTVS